MTLRRFQSLLAGPLAAVAVSACYTWAGGSAADGGSDVASTADGAPPGDAGRDAHDGDATVAETGTDGGADASIDGPAEATADAPPGNDAPVDCLVAADGGCVCNATASDPLTTVSPSWDVGPDATPGLPFASTCVTASVSAGDLEAGVDAGSIGCVQVTIDTPYVDDTLTWSAPVPLDAFDVSVTFTARCRGTGCGDGMALLFLDTLDPSHLPPYHGGGDLGVPLGVGGYGVALDLFQNPAPINDPPTPAWEILGLDAKRAPGDYDWHLASTGASTDMGGGITVHTLTAKLRSGTLTATLDGATLLQAAVTTFPAGVFGFAAATGASTAILSVDQLEATFYGTAGGCPSPP